MGAARADKIIVWLSTGETVTYYFADRPKVIPGKNDVRITTPAEDVVYQAGEVLKITFEDVGGIEGTTADDPSRGVVSVDGDFMLLSGFQPGEQVYIFDVSGKLVFSQTIGDSGSLRIGLSDFSRGIYLLKTNHQSSKFIKK